MPDSVQVLVTGRVPDVIEQVERVCVEIRGDGAGIVRAVPWEQRHRHDVQRVGWAISTWPSGDGRVDGDWTHVVWVGDASDMSEAEPWWQFHLWADAARNRGVVLGRPFMVEASIWRANSGDNEGSGISFDWGRVAVEQALRGYLEGER